MTEVIKLAAELFAHHSGRIQTEIGGFNIGQLPVAQTPDMESSARTGRQKSSKCKISTAFLLFDILFKHERSLSLYGNEDAGTLYGELDGVSFYIDDDNRMTTSGEFVHHRHKAIPYVLYALYTADAASELMRSFSEVILGNVLPVKPGTPTVDLETAAFKFCDSFYYNYAVDHKEMEADIGDLRPETIQRLFDGGDLKKITLGLPEKYYGESYYDKGIETAESGTKKPEADPVEVFRQECLDGKYVVDYDGWDDDDRKNIVPMSFLDSFIFTKDFMNVVKLTAYQTKKALDRRAEVPFDNIYGYADTMVNMALFGKPGTGKTTFMKALSAVMQRPLTMIGFSKHTDESVFQGQATIVDGHPEFVLTDIARDWDKGYIIDLEEVNAADPSVLLALNLMLDNTGLLKVQGVHDKYRHPLTAVFACMNIGLDGTQQLPQALANRFTTSKRLKDPTEEDFKKTLAGITGQNRKVVDWVYDAYQEAINWLKSDAIGAEDVVPALSLRTCVGCINNMKGGESPKDAVIDSIGGAIAMQSDELGEMFETEVVETQLKNPNFIVTD